MVREHPVAVMLWVAVGGIPAGAASGILPTDIGNAARVALGIGGVAAGTLLVLASIFAWAFLTARHHQLDDRVGELQEEVRELATMVKPEPTTFRSTFRLLREEARDNHRMMKLAAERGTYWKLTEDAPSTKQWKKHRELLGQESSYADLYEKGRVVAQEVERVLQARSVRTFVGRNRRVDDEDRLPEVVQLLEEYERDLTSALELLEAGRA